MNFNRNLFPKSFLVIETIVEHEKESRYFILNVDFERGKARIKTVGSLGEGMAETIRLLESRRKGDMFHISLLKRHDDGTFNVVGYRESENTKSFNVVSPHVVSTKGEPPNGYLAFIDSFLANKLLCNPVIAAIPRPMFRAVKAPMKLRLERARCTKMRVGVVIPTSIHDKVRIVRMRDSYKAYYPVIGCERFDVVELDEADGKSVDCYVDDEGMLNGSPVNEYWLRAYQNGLTRQPLFGICVVSMTDLESGESTKTDLSTVKATLKKFGFKDRELSF